MPQDFDPEKAGGKKVDPNFDPVAAGGNMVQQSPQTLPPEPKKEGFGRAMLNDLGSMAKRAFVPPLSWEEAGQRLRGVGEMFAGPSATTEQRTQQMEDYGRRRDAGYGPIYSSVAAPTGEMMGVNMRGQEEAAARGDVGGVLGHMAAVPVTMLATEGISGLAGTRAGRFAGELGKQAAGDIPIVRKVGPAWEASKAPSAAAPNPTPDVYQRGYSQPRAYPVQTAEPIPSRTGLMLPGEVRPVTAYDNVADIRSRLVGNPTDPFAGLDKVRAQLTSPEAMAARGQSTPLGEIAAPTGPGSTEAAKAYPLGQIRPTGPKPVEAPSIEAETKQAIKEGRAAKIPTRVKAKPTEVAKPPETPQKPVTEPGKTERQTGYMFGEHAHEVDIGSGTHNEIRAKTYPELAEYANKRGLRGKTDWKVEDFERSVAKHGKSSNPNTSYVRGEMAKEAKARPQALAKPAEPEKPFDPFDEMAAFKPGRSVHDVLGMKGGVPKEKK